MVNLAKPVGYYPTESGPAFDSQTYLKVELDFCALLADLMIQFYAFFLKSQVTFALYAQDTENATRGPGLSLSISIFSYQAKCKSD